MKIEEQSSLHKLFEAIAQAKTEGELQQSVMTAIGSYFLAKRWRLWLSHEITDESIKKIEHSRQTNTLIKKALSVDKNPVLRYLVERHSAVHDEVILPPGIWKTICPRADHGHVMVGPLINQGKLVGGIAVTRHRSASAFNTEELADLSALSIHISTRFTAIHSSTGASPTTTSLTDTKLSQPTHLTPRETEIAELVAQGLTNKKIGAALWISENSVKQALKRMFRKLEVSSRAEMVAQLAAQPYEPTRLRQPPTR